MSFASVYDSLVERANARYESLGDVVDAFTGGAVPFRDFRRAVERATDGIRADAADIASNKALAADLESRARAEEVVTASVADVMAMVREVDRHVAGLV